MKVQFVAGKTEVVLQLRGRGKKAANANLAAHKPPAKKQCVAQLPLDGGECVRVVTCCAQVGASAAVADNGAQDLAHRRSVAQSAGKGCARTIQVQGDCCHSYSLFFVIRSTHLVAFAAEAP